MAPNRSVVRTAARPALGFAALCVILGIIELGLRLFFHPISKPWDFRIPHPSLGWSLEPGATYAYEGIEFRVAVSYNGRGWRDLPRTFEKPDGIFRVVLLGDSYMEGYTVELEEAFHRQLERRLVAAGRRVEVINLAVGGFGTLQELLVLEQEGLRFDPDLVILAFHFGNDVENNAKFFQSLRYPVDYVKVASRPFLRPGAASEWIIDRPDYEGAKARFEQAHREVAARPWWVRTSIAQLYMQADIGRRWSKLMEERGWRPRPDEVECNERPEYEEAWRTTERILARLQQVAERQGAALPT